MPYILKLIFAVQSIAHQDPLYPINLKTNLTGCNQNNLFLKCLKDRQLRETLFKIQSLGGMALNKQDLFEVFEISGITF